MKTLRKRFHIIQFHEEEEVISLPLFLLFITSNPFNMKCAIILLYPKSKKNYSIQNPAWLRRLERTLCCTLNPGLEFHQCVYVHVQVDLCGAKILSWNAGYQEISNCCSTGESEEPIACW